MALTPKLQYSNLEKKTNYGRPMFEALGERVIESENESKRSTKSKESKNIDELVADDEL